MRLPLACLHGWGLNGRVFDVLDGVMARITKSSSDFGVEFDSLSDVVSFGAAPAFLVHRIVLRDVAGGRTVHHNRSLAAARAADNAIASGMHRPLEGIPIAHKDIFCAQGWLTTCGSRMLSNFVSPYDAHVIERFNAAGAVILGKTNMDEFAMGSSNENSAFGPVLNPWNDAHVAGGSSGGSAAAVAAGLAPIATGTDTMGVDQLPPWLLVWPP